MANPQPHPFTKFSNELFDYYLKISRFLSPYENTVWLCILRKTYGFNKKEDWISLKQIEDITGIRQPHVVRTKEKLLLKNMIVIDNKKISLQKDYEKWNIPKQVYLNRYNIPKQVYPNRYNIPKQVTKHTQTGNKNLPEQVTTKEIKETITKERTPLTKRLLTLTDEDFIKKLKENPAYAHINIDNELSKMDAWLLVHKGRQKTRRFIVNWLNKIDKPLEQLQPVIRKKPNPNCPKCKGTGFYYDENNVFRGKCSCGD